MVQRFKKHLKSREVLEDALPNLFHGLEDFLEWINTAAPRYAAQSIVVPGEPLSTIRVRERQPTLEVSAGVQVQLIGALLFAFLGLKKVLLIGETEPRSQNWVGI